jgi:hypothetical protein
MNSRDQQEYAAEEAKIGLFVGAIIVVLTAVLPVVIIWSNTVYVFQP